jgi:hypothetical protein
MGAASLQYLATSYLRHALRTVPMEPTTLETLLAELRYLDLTRPGLPEALYREYVYGLPALIEVTDPEGVWTVLDEGQMRCDESPVSCQRSARQYHLVIDALLSIVDEPAATWPTLLAPRLAQLPAGDNAIFDAAEALRFSQFVSRAVLAEARWRLFVLSAADLTFYVRTGEVAQRMTDLAPLVGVDLVRDPFTGEDFQFGQLADVRVIQSTAFLPEGARPEDSGAAPIAAAEEPLTRALLEQLACARLLP